MRVRDFLGNFGECPYSELPLQTLHSIEVSQDTTLNPKPYKLY